MPITEPPPEQPGSFDVPNCAVSYLFELNGLHYYETVNCETGTTGWGVSGDHFIPQGCVGEQCAEGSVVTPVRLTRSLASAAPTDTPGSKGKRRRFPGKSRTSKRRLGRDLVAFKNRYTGVGAPNDVATRRRNIANWVADNVADLANNPIHRAFFEYVSKELVRVRVDLTDTTGAAVSMLLTEDRDLAKETIGNGLLADMATSASGGAPPVELKDAVVNQQAPQAPDKYVHLTAKGNPNNPGNIDVYFRLQTFEFQRNGITYVLHLGQQIHVEDVQTQIPLNKVAEAVFIDRHEYFHVIQVDGVLDPVSGNVNNNVDFFVYSAESLEARESLT